MAEPLNSLTIDDLMGTRQAPSGEPSVAPAPVIRSPGAMVDPVTGEIPGARSALMEPGEATEALGTGITQGLLETVPFGGAVAGGALGLKIGAATPIPGGAFIGGLAGTVGGYLAGQKAEEAGKTLLPMTRPQVEAYRQGGKTFGSSVAMLAPFSLATRTPKAGEVAVREVANRLPQNSVDWVKSILAQPLAFLRQRLWRSRPLKWPVARGPGRVRRFTRWNGILGHVLQPEQPVRFWALVRRVLGQCTNPPIGNKARGSGLR